MAKIEIQKSDTFGDVQIVMTPHPAERNITHLTWEELQILVTEGKKLLDRRASFDFDCGLTESELDEIRNGQDTDYYEYTG